MLCSRVTSKPSRGRRGRTDIIGNGHFTKNTIGTVCQMITYSKERYPEQHIP